MLSLALVSLLKCLEEGTNSIDYLRECSGLGDYARIVVARLQEAGKLRVEGDSVIVGAGERVDIAVEAARMGANLTSLSRLLSWRDFEAFATRILEEEGYSCFRSLRIPPRRLEIDVLGVRYGFALAIDCKHWSYYARSKLEAAGRAQRRRAEELIRRGLGLKLGFSEVLPVLLVLQEPSSLRASGSCVVSVAALREFARIARGIEDCAQLTLSEL